MKLMNDLEVEMFHVRLMVTAFIFNRDRLLLMKRSPQKSLHPGIWAGIGGHLESHELTAPRQACFREILEETGLVPTDFSSFDLRYIVLSKKQEELRQQFVYIGQTVKYEVESNDEGELHWIPHGGIFERPLTNTSYFILKKYLCTEPHEDELLVGVVTTLSEETRVAWYPLTDWETAHMTPSSVTT